MKSYAGVGVQQLGRERCAGACRSLYRNNKPVLHGHVVLVPKGPVSPTSCLFSSYACLRMPVGVCGEKEGGSSGSTMMLEMTQSVKMVGNNTTTPLPRRTCLMLVHRQSYSSTVPNDLQHCVDAFATACCTSSVPLAAQAACFCMDQAAAAAALRQLRIDPSSVALDAYTTYLLCVWHNSRSIQHYLMPLRNQMVQSFERALHELVSSICVFPLAGAPLHISGLTELLSEDRRDIDVSADTCKKRPVTSWHGALQSTLDSFSSMMHRSDELMRPRDEQDARHDLISTGVQLLFVPRKQPSVDEARARAFMGVVLCRRDLLSTAVQALRRVRSSDGTINMDILGGDARAALLSAAAVPFEPVNVAPYISAYAGGDATGRGALSSQLCVRGAPPTAFVALPCVRALDEQLFQTFDVFVQDGDPARAVAGSVYMIKYTSMLNALALKQCEYWKNCASQSSASRGAPAVSLSCDTVCSLWEEEFNQTAALEGLSDNGDLTLVDVCSEASFGRYGQPRPGTSCTATSEFLLAAACALGGDATVRDAFRLASSLLLHHAKRP